MLDVREVKQAIAMIESGDESPLRKARRLLMLHNQIDRVTRDLGVDISESTRAQIKMLRRAQEDARLSALRVLRARPVALGFHLQPSAARFTSPRSAIRLM